MVVRKYVWLKIDQGHKQFHTKFVIFSSTVGMPQDEII